MTIAVEHLTVTYPGGHTALRGISLRAEPGRITVVIGPNAAGKSTLLRAVVGAIRCPRGQIQINGGALRGLRPRDLARSVAYVPQRSTIAAAYTVREVVGFGRFATGRSTSRIERAIECMQLTEHADRLFHALSVGQQQRVTLARALAQLEPGGNLVLDEPTSAMDLAHQLHALSILREVADAGATVLLAMHDLAVAARHADHACLLQSGTVAAVGPASEVIVPANLSPVFGVRFGTVQTGGRDVLCVEGL